MTSEFLLGAQLSSWPHPMIGGLWKLHDPLTKRQVITDEDALSLYLPTGKLDNQCHQYLW